MSVLEVTSELYAEAEFCSTDTGNGNAISKFTFVYPNRRETDANGTPTGQPNGMDKRTNGLPETGKEKTPSIKDPDEESFIEEQSYESDYDDDSVCEEEEIESENECCQTSDQSVASPVPPIKLDKDDDLDVERQRKGAIEIEHRKSTRLDLVGLQIWRGALLLADYIMHNERKFKNAHILELGSGVGLTSIVASMYAREVICTDIDIGGLLDLIRGNVQRNAHLSNPHCRVHVTELDFKASYQDYPRELKDKLQHVQYVVAADVIYDDDITEAFVRTIVSLLLELPKLKAIYIALEKRYVFTLEDMDSVAPCYDYFLRYFQKRNSRFGVNRWKLINVCMNFPRYFDYDKVKDLVLLKICHASSK
ncbi:methyltransferase-like protein 22 isoform X1 [Anopheles stephensi]|uniref:methyltransferase-like protein 22 isoform X1 n=1 Tax=Anopheles stephensi TaxID=30069 RepID=UPI0007D13EEB|nr:methyltransferase-like protein 22 isoform X1 [Anopheles stephensi]XP_035897942.1 methyltransferase-like protein 22 isoform X1 [Anopheles stephensi]XP_035897943.1 methyltransferase-like protein 22 isoform X1 [Anopheles stephensi]